VTQALATITKRVEESIDRMKVSSGNLPVVLVGGGSILIGTNLAGATEVWRPEHYEAANAIGAAIAQISGEIDRVYECASRSRETILDEAKAEAIQRAITAGARPDSVEIVDVYDIPLAYLPSQAIRVRVKAVGQA
jgi:N-methylhydantoinase A/oxoprolinase/acetone carboxylase beta subunit